MMIADFSIKANIAQISYIQSDLHHFLVSLNLLTENSHFSFADENHSIFLNQKAPPNGRAFQSFYAKNIAF
jgi:hypothetical protein